jgi:hypothetical protein
MNDVLFVEHGKLDSFGVTRVAPSKFNVVDFVTLLTFYLLPFSAFSYIPKLYHIT